MDEVGSDSDRIEIELAANATQAADRLGRALRDSIGPGAVTPRIAGRVNFPEVSVWRSRGRFAPSPLARFDGAIQPRGNGSALVGRIEVPASGSFIASVIVFPTIAIAALAALMGVSSGKLAGVIGGLGFAGLLLGYLYLARRVARANVRAERELLIRELRDLVKQHAEADS